MADVGGAVLEDVVSLRLELVVQPEVLQRHFQEAGLHALRAPEARDTGAGGGGRGGTKTFPHDGTPMSVFQSKARRRALK